MTSNDYWCTQMAEKPVKVDLDNILVDELGQFGRYQIMTLLLTALPIMFSGFSAGEYIFTTARIPTRCLIPECDGLNPEFSPSWKANAIPRTSNGDFDNCARYSNNTYYKDDTCPIWFFDTNRTEKCQEYVYENTNSIVYDFNLACNEWKRSQIGAIRTMGSLIVLPFIGYISDRWGRRVALTITTFNAGWVGLVRSFVNSYEWYLALEFLECTIGCGAYSSSYILVMELVGPKYRVVAGASMATIYALGQVVLGFIAWGVQPWRTLTQVLYAPQLVVVCYFWILSESVRWLMSKGRYEESEKILMKVAKMNGKELSQKSRVALRLTTEAEKKIDKPKEEWLPILLMKSKTILLRISISPIWWFTNTLIYHGMNVNSVNLLGNSYLNYVAVAAVEIPGYWTAIFLLDRIGRKPVLIGGYALCAACQFIFAFLPDGRRGLSMVVYLIAKYCIATVMSSVYVYTAELFPTEYRHRVFAFSTMMGRIGTISAPLTPSLGSEIWEKFPSVLFGCFALISGSLISMTPETLGTKLPDTIEEAEQLKYTRKTAKNKLQEQG